MKLRILFSINILKYIILSAISKREEKALAAVA